ncbi:trans-sialidase, putative, partial [Trypanosoma cruzi]
ELDGDGGGYLLLVHGGWLLALFALRGCCPVVCELCGWACCLLLVSSALSFAVSA